jgi:hypothetical protein
VDLLPAATARALLAAFRALGLDADAIRSGAAIAPESLEPVDGALPAAAFARLWEGAFRRAPREELPAEVGLAVPFGGFGALDYLAASSPDVRSAFHSLATHFRSVSAGFGMEVEEDGGGAEVRLVWERPDAAREVGDDFTLAVLIGRFRATAAFAAGQVRLTRRHPGPGEPPPGHDPHRVPGHSRPHDLGADVVDPDVPGPPAGSREGVGEAPGAPVALEDEYPPPVEAREERRRGEPPHPRADDDGVRVVGGVHGRPPRPPPGGLAGDPGAGPPPPLDRRGRSLGPRGQSGRPPDPACIPRALRTPRPAARLRNAKGPLREEEPLRFRPAPRRAGGPSGDRVPMRVGLRRRRTPTSSRPSPSPPGP